MRYFRRLEQSKNLCDAGIIEPVNRCPSTKAQLRNEIAEHTKSFLQSGGKVKKLPTRQYSAEANNIKLNPNKRRIIRTIMMYKTCVYAKFKKSDMYDINELLEQRVMARGNGVYWLTDLGKDVYFKDAYVINYELHDTRVK